MLPTVLRRISRYIAHFGLRSGLQAARMHSHWPRPVRIRLPGIEHPFWTRPSTSDTETFSEIFVARQYDVPFPDFEPAHILDLGANVGFASVYFAARWPRARILAVEPAAENFALLEKNMRPWGRIEPVQAAVWSRQTALQIANPGAAANTFRMNESADPIQGSISAHTVPQLMDRMGCDRLDFLKIDVEGAEAEILRHADDWLDRVDVMMIELHDLMVPGCGMALNAALQGRSYRQAVVGGNLAFDFRP